MSRPPPDAPELPAAPPAAPEPSVAPSAAPAAAPEPSAAPEPAASESSAAPEHAASEPSAAPEHAASEPSAAPEHATSEPSAAPEPSATPEHAASEHAATLEHAAAPEHATSEHAATPEHPAARLLAVLQAAARGDRDVRLPEGEPGLFGELYRACKDILADNRRLADALDRVRVELTRVTGRVPPEDIGAAAADLITHIRAIDEVVVAVTEGDLTRAIDLDARGELGALARSVNQMIATLRDTTSRTVAANRRTEELLAQSQALAEELRAQHRELTVTNIRLEDQARALRASKERLRQAQEELQRKNQALERRFRLLEQQNAEVERARLELEERAQQLLQASKYKSEFLANMSHELRTPLNSLLILAQLLADNPTGNLDARQVEFARTIHSAGSELLALINDILDLSKIESGAMGIDIEDLVVADLRDQLERSFRPVAETRGLEFRITLCEGLPRVIETDPRRLLQILKNLLSNAFKFTHRGEVELRISPAAGLGVANGALAFAVIDTGIGIPAHKQRLIFEAFQQADGTTSRKYGGTGLGLSISRELAHLLGGEITVHSTPGVGSTFTLFLPPRPGVALDTADSVCVAPPPEPVVPAPAVDDDRARVRPGEPTLLIIEDDLSFARLLLDLARDHGFRGVVALRGDDGLGLARELRPDAITLDLRLPGLDGWSVLERLRHDPQTRHIPVHAISGVERESGPRPRRSGSLAYLPRPLTRDALTGALAGVDGFVERGVRDLLLIVGDPRLRQTIVELIGASDVVTTAVTTATEGLQLLRERRFDGALIDLGLPERSGFDVIRAIRSDDRLRELPLLCHGRDLSADDEAELTRLTRAIARADDRSIQHLLDETARFLHRVTARPAQARWRPAPVAQRDDPVLAGKTVLIVDDDVRNIFAVTSVLERQGMLVLFAEDGRRGLELLRTQSGVDVVLLDVMMPEMDGYEAMREIRSDPRLAHLPLVALTAKALLGDRERCLAAGASDYLTKPVEPDRLLTLLRAHLGAS